MKLKMRVYDTAYPYRDWMWEDIEFEVVKCSVTISSGTVKFREAPNGIEYVYNIAYLADVVITPGQNDKIKLCTNEYNSYEYPKILYIDFRREMINFYYIPNNTTYSKNVIASLQSPDNDHNFENICMDLDSVVFVLCADDRL